MARRSLQVKRKRSEILYQRLIILALFLASIVLARAVYSLWQKNKLAEANLTATANQFDKLMARQTKLGNKIERLKTERGFEEEIRSNFAVVKPGERVINIVDNAKATTTATSAPAEKSWWQIW